MGVSAYPVATLPSGMVMPYAGSTTPDGWLLCDGSAVSRTVYANLFAAVGTTYGTGDGSTTFNLPNLKGKVIAGLDAGQTEFATRGQTGGEKTHLLTTAESAAHTHQFAHGHGTDNQNTDHAHNVYGTGAINTGGTSASHLHEFNSDGNAYSQVWTGSTSHSHQGSGGTTSEQPWGGGNWATNHYHHGWTAGQNADHGHDYNHSHPSTNFTTQSPWAGNYNHAHAMVSQTTSTTDNGTGGATAHNNLQPYFVMNYLIKI